MSGAGPAMATAAAGRLLVVDDEPGVRLALQRVLTRSGYEVSVADNGLAAVARLRERSPFTAVVSDITMSAMTGLELGAYIGCHHPRLPVLYVSSTSIPASLLDNPLVGYVTKPVNAGSLHDHLRELIDRAHPAHDDRPLSPATRWPVSSPAGRVNDTANPCADPSSCLTAAGRAAPTAQTRLPHPMARESTVHDRLR